MKQWHTIHIQYMDVKDRSEENVYIYRSDLEKFAAIEDVIDALEGAQRVRKELEKVLGKSE